MGDGSFIFQELNAEERLELQNEKVRLEAELDQIPAIQARLNELLEVQSAVAAPS